MTRAQLASGLALVAAMIAIATGWTSLGLPRPAFSGDLVRLAGEIGDLQKFTRDTRSIILNQEWWRLQGQIDDLHGKVQANPGDATLRAHERRLQQNQADVQQQIDRLN